jgi:hypothetical protein
VTTFNDAVHQCFDPLAGRHGLRCVSSTPEIVRFANEKVFLQIGFDAVRSFEVGVEVGEISTSTGLSERPFNLAEVLKLHSSPDATYVERLQASKPDVLVRAIEKLSMLTEKYATDLLDGVAIDFVRLGEFRDKECTEYALSRDLGYAREDAEKAWKNKNYLAVVEAYKPFEAMLSEVERKRLVFAEKHNKMGS